MINLKLTKAQIVTVLSIAPKGRINKARGNAPGKPQRGDINKARGTAPGKPQRGDINKARGTAANDARSIGHFASTLLT
ncbi:MAG: hypothetical protein DRR19_26305 [Candidatus Parabeggiatoa sp. nov. 1]|nr:MAG: hypothetical protein DRR19_26305 [Gammaproteobacteria bacterium]